MSLQALGYEELRCVGRGQSGTCHLVRRNDQELLIAKKIPVSAQQSKERDLAYQEVELLKRLDHPNIVEYVDSFVIKCGTLIIVMQYCEGGDMAQYINDVAKKNRPFSETQIMNWFVQILQALQYIHSLRILHRDLKTSNIFLTRNTRVCKVGDFGIARILESTMDAAITVMGTPYYLSPEVCENKPYTFKSDVWSLGCVLYEMCVLKHAFAASNLLGLVYKIVSNTYDPIPARYPQDMSDLIRSALTKKVDARASVEELLQSPYVVRFMSDFIEKKGALENAQRLKPRGVELRHSPTRESHKKAAGASPCAVAETPKEAAARRKREAADRKGDALKSAAKEAAKRSLFAKQLREEQFRRTCSASSSAPQQEEHNGFHNSRSLQDLSFRHTLIEEATPDLGFTASSVDSFWSLGPPWGPGDSHMNDEKSPVQGRDEISYNASLQPMQPSGARTSDGEESSDTYEDDFEAESDEGDAVESADATDFSRVMHNYQAQLTKIASGTEGRPVSALPTSKVVLGPANVATRTSRLREECVRHLGARMFESAYKYLLGARKEGRVSEKEIKRGIIQRTGAEMYQRCGFSLDQLVWQDMQCELG